MPYLTGPMTRRTALLAIGGTLVGCHAIGRRGGRDSGAAQRVVFISDPHIAADPSTLSREGVNMHDRLAAIVGEVVAMDPPPDLVIVNGDNALRDGQPEDYAMFAALLKPMHDAGLNVACTLGNHDDRDAFLERWVVRDRSDYEHGLVDRRCSVIETPHASFVLLDSLDVVNETPGELGGAQREWLDAVLTIAGQRGRPALIVLHHPPVEPAPGETLWGLRDHDAFWSVVERHPHVAGVIHGHAHRWEPRVHGPTGVPVLGLPATSYPFRPQDATGYAVGTLGAAGWSVTLEPRGETAAAITTPARATFDWPRVVVS